MSDPHQPPSYVQISRTHKGVDADARRQERRRKLIDAGLETLGTKGYHSTTVNDVCEVAGLSKRYFYESFSELSDLFGAVFQHLHAEWMGRLMIILVDSRRVQTDPMVTAEAALTTWLVYLKEDTRRARILMVDAIGASKQNMFGAQAAMRDYVGAIQTVVELLYPELARTDLSPRALASMIAGGCILTIKEWIWSDFSMPMDEVVKHLLLMFRGMRQQVELLLSKQG